MVEYRALLQLQKALQLRPRTIHLLHVSRVREGDADPRADLPVSASDTTEGALDRYTAFPRACRVRRRAARAPSEAPSLLTMPAEHWPCGTAPAPQTPLFAIRRTAQASGCPRKTSLH